MALACGRPRSAAPREATADAAAPSNTESDTTATTAAVKADAGVATPQPDASPTNLPVPGPYARHEVWLRATYGKREDQLSGGKYEVGLYPPQGFAPTADGRLLVLDGVKRRLVWFSTTGKFERAVPLDLDTRLPDAALAVLADGRIVVVTSLHGVLLNAAGEKQADLPFGFPHSPSPFHAVGTALYGSPDGMTEEKVGDVSSTGTDSARANYPVKNNTIPGHLLPDGTTVLSVDFEDRKAGTFWVSAVRGENARPVFRRTYRNPTFSAVSLIQADARGRIYMAINWGAKLTLVCLDGSTGDPVGSIDLPFSKGVAEQTQTYAVVPSGGLVVAAASPKGVRYELFDCHPPLQKE